MNHIIRIAGGTASGKSTLARRFAEEEECLLIQHDRYYRDIPHPRGFNFDEPEALDNSLLAHHLSLLQRGESAELPVYHFPSHSRLTETEICQPKKIILLEGILVMACPEFENFAALDVFVDAPADIRLLRRIKRDVLERGRDVNGVIDQYLATVRPMHEKYVADCKGRADIVLDGCAPIEDGLQRLREAISAL